MKKPKPDERDALMTQLEVAEVLGVTRIAVQQIEKRALKKAKRILNRQRIGKDILPD